MQEIYRFAQQMLGSLNFESIETALPTTFCQLNIFVTKDGYSTSCYV